MDLIDLEIINWDKYQNGKKSEKYTSLMSFRLASNFFSDNKIIRLSGHSKLLFVYLLCECANRNSRHVTISMRKTALALLYKRFSVSTSILELESFQLVKKIYAHNKIKEKKRKEKVISLPSPEEVFNPDVESIYQIYPKKVGKKKGMEQLAKIITNQELYDQVLIGTKNYIESCQNENRYFKDFSTFVSQEVWEDYQQNNEQFLNYIQQEGRL